MIMTSIGHGIIRYNIGEFEKKYKSGEIKDFIDKKYGNLSDDCDIKLLFKLLGISVISSDVNIKNNEIISEISCVSDNLNELGEIFAIMMKNGIINAVKIPFLENETSGKISIVISASSANDKFIKIIDRYNVFFTYYVGGIAKDVYLCEGKFYEVAREQCGNAENDIKNGKSESDAAKLMYDTITNPWDSMCRNYRLSFDDCGICECEYSVIVYDDLEVSIYGYGNNPKEAIDNIEKRIGFLRRFDK